MRSRRGEFRTTRTIARTTLGAVLALVATGAVLPLPADAGHTSGSTHSTRGTHHSHITDLGTLGGRHSVVDAVSADGRYVAGRSTTTDGAQHVYLWHRGRMADLGVEGFATGVDLRGRVVGLTPGPAGADPIRGFLWQRGVLTYLPSLGGDTATPATVTPSGLIVGAATDGEGTSHAVTWSAGPGSRVRVHDLGLLGPGAVDARCGRVLGNTFVTDGEVSLQPFVLGFGHLRRIPLAGGAVSMPAAAINCRGDVAGYVEDGSDTTRGFLTRHRRTQVFPLGGPDATVAGLDLRGAVYFNGTASTEPGVPRAFVRRGGTSRALTGPGGAFAEVNAVNQAGLAVGSFTRPDPSGTLALHPVSWLSERPRALPGLGGAGGQATDVSQNGLVFGEAQTADGATHAVRWTLHCIHGVSEHKTTTPSRP